MSSKYFDSFQLREALINLLCRILGLLLICSVRKKNLLIFDMNKEHFD